MIKNTVYVMDITKRNHSNEGTRCEPFSNSGFLVLYIPCFSPKHNIEAKEDRRREQLDSIRDSQSRTRIRSAKGGVHFGELLFSFTDDPIDLRHGGDVQQQG